MALSVTPNLVSIDFALSVALYLLSKLFRAAVNFELKPCLESRAIALEMTLSDMV